MGNTQGQSRNYYQGQYPHGPAPGGYPAGYGTYPYQYYYPQTYPPPYNPYPSFPHNNPTGVTNGQFFLSNSGGDGGQPQSQPWPQSQYPLPPTVMNEPQATVTIRNDVNVKGRTVKLERDPEDWKKYVVSFTFDAVVPGSLSVFLVAKEGEDCQFTPLHPELHSPVKTHFEKGLGQSFRQPAGSGFDLSKYLVEELSQVGHENVIPLVIRTEAASSSSRTSETDPPSSQEDEAGAPLPKSVQSQMTYAAIIRVNRAGKEFEGNIPEEESFGLNRPPDYEVKILGQKIWANGLKYEVQEIFGIESSGPINEGNSDEDAENEGKECVVCLSAPRDTTVLPCRHMCMCSGCAKVLRLQSNRCPICRQVVERLLEIKVPATNKGPENERAELA